MTLLFRIILLAVCLFTYFFLHHSIKKERMRIEESIFWLILSLLLLVFLFSRGYRISWQGFSEFIPRRIFSFCS